MAKTLHLNSRTLLVALAIGLAAAAVAWLVAEPLNAAFVWATQFLSRPIADTGDGVARAVLP